MSEWDSESIKILLLFLCKREYLYNRNHPDYKTYTVVTECADFGKCINPHKSGKEVLDKITSLRKDITFAKQIIEDDGSNEYIISDLSLFEKNVIDCSFMYTALFGTSFTSIKLKLKQFLKKSSKRKLNEELLLSYNKKSKFDTEITQNSSNVNVSDSLPKFEVSYIPEDEDIYKNQEMIPIENETENYISENIVEETNIFDNDVSLNSHPNEDFTEDNTTTVSSCSEQDNEIDIFEDVDPYKILYLECTDEVATQDEIITLKIINFIRNKPYYYKKDSDLYKTDVFKNRELTHFGRTFKPPIAGKRLLEIINKILKKFYNSIKKPENKRWCWFNECRFLVHNISENIDIQIKLKYPTVDVEKLEKTRIEDPKLLIDIVSFLEDNPCFYDENDENFFNSDKKNAMKTRFKTALQFNYNESEMSKMLDWVENRISQQLKKNYLDLTNVSRNFSHDLVVGENESYEQESECTKPIKHSVAYVQCNLYEELWKQRVDDFNLNDRNCNCVEEFIQTFPTFNENDLNDPLFEEPFLISQEPDRINKDDKNDFECNEGATIGNYMILLDDPDFSDYSTDDGLTEIPIPDIETKTRTRLPNGKFACEDCNEVFDNGTLLFAHEKTHGEKALICYKCGNISKYYRSLRMHENNCNPHGNKYCYECKLTFKSHLNYFDHNNQFHTKSNPYVCVCRQAFTSYNKIITHLNRSDCGSIEDCVLPEYVEKDFIRSFLEQRYEDEEKFVQKVQKTKFWCKICRRNFVRNDVYMKHFKREFHLKAEKVWLKEYGIENLFPCDYCNDDDEPKIFPSLYELVAHRHGDHHKCTLTPFFEEMQVIAKQFFELEADLSLIRLMCRICKRIYDMNDFKDHFRTKEHVKCERNWIINNNLTSFTCDICSINFDSLIGFLNHKYDTHLEWPTNKLIKLIEGTDVELMNKKYFKYYCSICDFKTCNKKFYCKHLSHHGSHYKCSCGITFRSYEKFVSHKSIHNCEVNGSIQFSASLFKKRKVRLYYSKVN